MKIRFVFQIVTSISLPMISIYLYIILIIYFKYFDFCIVIVSLVYYASVEGNFELTIKEPFSIFQYLELRFESHAVRMFGTMLGMIHYVSIY